MKEWMVMKGVWGLKTWFQSIDFVVCCFLSNLQGYLILYGIVYLYSCSELHTGLRGKVLPCAAPAGTLAFSSWVLYFGSSEQYQGHVVCLAWVCHSSFGFLLEIVIFNLLCEEKGIILLLLLEGLPNAFEWNSGTMYCGHPPWPVLHHE